MSNEKRSEKKDAHTERNNKRTILWSGVCVFMTLSTMRCAANSIAIFSENCGTVFLCCCFDFFFVPLRWKFLLYLMSFVCLRAYDRRWMLWMFLERARARQRKRDAGIKATDNCIKVGNSLSTTFRVLSFSFALFHFGNWRRLHDICCQCKVITVSKSQNSGERTARLLASGRWLGKYKLDPSPQAQCKRGVVSIGHSVSLQKI